MKRFKKIYIEITNQCNLSCPFCPPTKREGKFMNVEFFTHILDQIKPYGEYLYFHIKGEPLLHPRLEELLRISYNKGFKVNITTNGTLLKKRKSILLNQPALRQINISLHSVDTYLKLDDQTWFVEDVVDFAKEAAKKGILISLRLWNLGENNGANLILKKNRHILEVIEKAFALDNSIEEMVIPGRGIKLKEGIYLNQDYEFQWPSLNEDVVLGEAFCYGLRTQIGILVDGTVVPCCLDGEGIINLGNIHSINFNRIIESDKVDNLIKGFSRKEAVEALCKRCGYRNRFAGSHNHKD